jgi:hypothetical protein
MHVPVPPSPPLAGHLEVLDRSLLDPPPEVQAPAPQLVVPLRLLVAQREHAAAAGRVAIPWPRRQLLLWLLAAASRGLCRAGRRSMGALTGRAPATRGRGWIGGGGEVGQGAGANDAPSLAALVHLLLGGAAALPAQRGQAPPKGQLGEGGQLHFHPAPRTRRKSSSGPCMPSLSLLHKGYQWTRTVDYIRRGMQSSHGPGQPTSRAQDMAKRPPSPVTALGGRPGAV